AVGRRETRHRPAVIHRRLQLGVDLGQALVERRDDVPDELALILGEPVLLLLPQRPRLRVGVAGDVRLVGDTKGDLAGAPARGGNGHTRLGGPGRRPLAAACRSAIVIAASAQRAPTLPCVPPVRASACAASCTASTPLRTGTPVSSATRCRP